MEFWKLSFSHQKTLEEHDKTHARVQETTTKKLQPQVALDVGDEPWPLGREASALVNVPPLLPNISKYMHLITTKKINMLKTPWYLWL